MWQTQRTNGFAHYRVRIPLEPNSSLGDWRARTPRANGGMLR